MQMYSGIRTLYKLSTFFNTNSIFFILLYKIIFYTYLIFVLGKLKVKLLKTFFYLDKKVEGISALSLILNSKIVVYNNIYVWRGGKSVGCKMFLPWQ